MAEEQGNETVREQRLGEAITAYLEAAEQGREPDRAALLARFPDLAADLAEFFAGCDQVGRLAEPFRSAAASLPVEATDTTVPFLEGRRPAGLLGVPGARAFGDYELLEEIGEGGMGVVYKALQRRLGRVVA